MLRQTKKQVTDAANILSTVTGKGMLSVIKKSSADIGALVAAGRELRSSYSTTLNKASAETYEMKTGKKLEQPKPEQSFSLKRK